VVHALPRRQQGCGSPVAAVPVLLAAEAAALEGRLPFLVPVTNSILETRPGKRKGKNKK